MGVLILVVITTFVFFGASSPMFAAVFSPTNPDDQTAHDSYNRLVASVNHVLQEEPNSVYYSDTTLFNLPYTHVIVAFNAYDDSITYYNHNTIMRPSRCLNEESCICLLKVPKGTKKNSVIDFRKDETNDADCTQFEGDIFFYGINDNTFSQMQVPYQNSMTYNFADSFDSAVSDSFDFSYFLVNYELVPLLKPATSDLIETMSKSSSYAPVVFSTLMTNRDDISASLTVDILRFKNLNSYSNISSQFIATQNKIIPLRFIMIAPQNIVGYDLNKGSSSPGVARDFIKKNTQSDLLAFSDGNKQLEDSVIASVSDAVFSFPNPIIFFRNVYFGRLSTYDPAIVSTSIASVNSPSNMKDFPEEILKPFFEYLLWIDGPAINETQGRISRVYALGVPTLTILQEAVKRSHEICLLSSSSGDCDTLYFKTDPCPQKDALKLDGMCLIDAYAQVKNSTGEQPYSYSSIKTLLAEAIVSSNARPIAFSTQQQMKEFEAAGKYDDALGLLKNYIEVKNDVNVKPLPISQLPLDFEYLKPTVRLMEAIRQPDFKYTVTNYSYPSFSVKQFYMISVAAKPAPRQYVYIPGALSAPSFFTDYSGDYVYDTSNQKVNPLIPSLISNNQKILAAPGLSRQSSYRYLEYEFRLIKVLPDFQQKLTNPDISIIIVDPSSLTTPSPQTNPSPSSSPVNPASTLPAGQTPGNSAPTYVPNKLPPTVP